jgi:hypothetical protein
MKKLRAERELIGDIDLKFRRALQGASGGNEQMAMFGEIDDGSDIESSVIAAAGFHGGAMIDFRAEQNILDDLPLHDHSSEAPVLMARAWIDAVTAAAIEMMPRGESLGTTRRSSLRMVGERFLY